MDEDATARLSSFSPIFPVRDLSRALAHYASLGFDVQPYSSGDSYGFADRDGAALHLSVATVKTHISRLLSKLDCRDRAQLVVVAYETGVAIPGLR